MLDRLFSFRVRKTHSESFSICFLITSEIKGKCKKGKYEAQQARDREYNYY
ncbi:hypothetical protein OAB27_00295 [bacterium]|nr:hypothetical protein [bacterium]